MGVVAFIASVQAELERHHWDTFVENPPSVARGGRGIVVPGCTFCKIRLNTTHRFLHHLIREILPRAIQTAIEKEKADKAARD